MKRFILIVLIATALVIILNSCDFFKERTDNKSNIDLYIETVKLPTALIQESHRAVITILIREIDFSNENAIEVNKKYQLLSFPSIPICSFEVSNGVYQPNLTLTLSPKATVDVYSGNLLIDTHTLTLASTILNSSLLKYESYNLSPYDSLTISDDDNFHILLNFSRVSDLYSDGSLATPSIYFAKTEDLVNVSGKVYGGSEYEEYRLEFLSPIYSYNTFTNSQNYNMKLFKGLYDVQVDVYETDNDFFPATSAELEPIEDIEKDFFIE